MATVRVPKKIRQCAIQAREWAEKVTAAGGPYHYIDDTMCGLCAIASVYLGSLLVKAGYEPIYALRQLPDQGEHCFIVCNGFVIDVTATQFDRKPIEILPVTEAPKHCTRWGSNIWLLDDTFITPEELVDRLTQDNWPEEQIPNIKEILA